MRIVLADDHRLFLEGLVNLLTAHGFDVVATAADGIEAVGRVQEHRPDVVLMDLRMPRRDGLAATRLIKVQLPDTRVVVLTTSEDDEDLFEAIRSGACGYLLKTVTGDELVDALHGLAEGVPPLSRGLAARLLAELARAPGPPLPELPPAPAGPTDPPPVALGSADEQAGGLTRRQVEVLRLVAAGLTYKEVAAHLALSERTVRYHMSEMIDRLHLQHRSQLLAYAGRMGLRADED
ncbi:MAG: response regulator transcription factor [Candidatus Limnocylindrales bacterium]